jgi:O-antigen ligase
VKLSNSTYQTSIFCLYLLSGELKFLFTYYQSPVDITLVFLLLILSDVLYALFVRPQTIRINNAKLFFLVIFLVFYFLFFISLLYTPSEFYAYKKTLYFSLCGVSLMYPLFIRNFDLRLFYLLTFVTIVPASLWFIVVKHLYWSGYATTIGSHFEPLLGSYIGLSIGIAFLIFYLVEEKEILKAFFLGLLLLALGSRGTFLFVIVVLCSFKWRLILESFNHIPKQITIRKTSIVAAILILAGVAAFWKPLASGFKFGMGRFESFVNLTSDNSTKERLQYYHFAITRIPESVQSVLVGHGIGSFGLLISGKEARDIPHNVFLEAWFELGLLGLFFLMALFTLPFLLKRNSVLKMMALFFLLDSLKSGGLDEMRFMFGIFGTLVFIKLTEVQGQKGIVNLNLMPFRT